MSLDITKAKVVGTRKGGKEVIIECPRCPPLRKKDARLEVNIEKGVAHCFRCGYSFTVKLKAGERRAVQEAWPDYSKERPEVGPVPENLYPVFVDRGCDPEYTISRYRIGWDGRRLCFPVGEQRYMRRAIYSFDEPKVIYDGKGHDFIGGEHLLYEGCHAVLVEGDWKACSIPQPWVGVFCGGVKLHEAQLDILQFHRPALVIAAMDGGYESDSKRIVKQLAKKLIPARVWEGLPDNCGPDDISQVERVKALIEISTKEE